MSDWPSTSLAALPPLIAEKLAAFDRLEPEFEASFPYIEEMQGERRFASVAVSDTVRYLHALWVCECKDRLLSVPQGIERYQGARALTVLRQWQETGETAETVAFLCEKLDTLDVARMSRQIEAGRRLAPESPLVPRLAHGRTLLVNRGMNLLHALDPLFALPADVLRDELRAACERFEHTPTQIAAQLRQLETPLYAIVRHPALAQRNMRVMNRQGSVDTSSMRAADEPPSQIWHLARTSALPAPYAEQIIAGYVLLRAPWHNNLRAVRWVDRPELLAAAMTGPHAGG